MMKKLNKKAFTLIELLVVIAVIGILVLFGAPRFKGHTQRAELTRIQHDIKVMEQEVGTVLSTDDDDFNKWGNNNKDLNQLIQEGKLFEKEGVVKADLPIDETYKVIPEEYKDKINTKLKGTFYANNNGKVYYEHTKPLGGIQTEPEKEPVYSDEEIEDLKNKGFIPVATAEELNNVRINEERTYGAGTKWEGEYLGGLDKNYVQVLNIDLSVYSEEGWNPIGTINIDASNEIELFNHVFTGTYDGGNYVITGLEVEGEIYQGLFGMIAEATIRNVNLIDNKVTGRYVVGGLVGGAYNSTIENSYATGSVEGTDSWGSGVGGLVGTANDSTIRNSYTTGSVTGKEFVGGLAGTANSSTIENSYATGSVKGSGSKSEEDEPILMSIDNINNSDTTGSENVGGLVGQAGDSTEISNSYATGSVEGTNNVGGLVGDAWNSTEIRNSYATGSVGGTELVGGLVGNATLNTEIRNSYATGSVWGTELVGGLVGEAEYSTIEKSYSTGSVEGEWNVGGLVGWASSNTISNSYATGSVEGGSWSNVGGLVGGAENSTIEKSYATGSVEGLGSSTYVGGLVGTANASTIEDSYATGSAKGIDAVGGLVGYAFNSIEISNSYATGLVEGEGDWVGGLVGWAQSGTTIENSYWNIETTKQDSSWGGGEGKTTSEMKKKETYTEWDFESVWKIDEGIDYPKLR